MVWMCKVYRFDNAKMGTLEAPSAAQLAGLIHRVEKDGAMKCGRMYEKRFHR